MIFLKHCENFRYFYDLSNFFFRLRLQIWSSCRSSKSKIKNSQKLHTFHYVLLLLSNFSTQKGRTNFDDQKEALSLLLKFLMHFFCSCFLRQLFCGGFSKQKIATKVHAASNKTEIESENNKNWFKFTFIKSDAKWKYF